MYCATVYGLRLACAEPIPGLAAELSPAPPASKPDLTVHYGVAPAWSSAAASVRYVHPEKADNGVAILSCSEAGAGQFRLDYWDGLSFFLDLGQARCWATWPESSNRDYATAYLLGPVLGFLLRLRGHVCLHASVIVTPGHCAAFVGASGAGKSTLAAALAQRGGEVLTEDVACLTARDGRFEVQPGYPLIRLWEESVPLLNGAGAPLDLQSVGWKKRCLQLGTGRHRFHAQPEALTAIYLLGARKVMAPAMLEREPGGREILERLVANTFGNYLLDRDMRASEFKVLGALARAVPVRELMLNDDGTRLREAVDAICGQLGL